MLRVVKNYTDELLNVFGLTISRIDQSDIIKDLSDIAAHPTEAYYFSSGKPFILTVPIEKCHAIEFSGANLNNPYLQTLLAYSNGTCTGYSNSPLQDFYSKWQPGTSQQFFKDGKELAPPWQIGFKKEINLADARIQRNDFVKIRKELGITTENISGHISRGPVTEAFGHITFNRFVKIYNSIKENGYQPEKVKSGHIRGTFYIKPDDYRVVISSGKHRIIALQALGFKKIPIQFGPPRFPVIVRRDDVDYWPNVKSGNYTRLEALSIFEEKFKAAHPSNWSI